MQVLVAYDVVTEHAKGQRRLRKVAQACKNYGQRVQKSVFECALDEMQYETLLNELRQIMDEGEDSLRVYRLREPKEQFVTIYGKDAHIDFEGPLVL